MAGKVVILLGPPGVGKGTQGVRLGRELGWAHVSTGDLLRAARREGTALGKRAQDLMDAGHLVSDDLILDLVQDRLANLDSSQGVLFDGFPRTVAQGEALDEVLAHAGRRVDHVVLLDADQEVLVQRISGRRSAPNGRVYNVFFDPPSTEGVCDETGEALIHRPDDQPGTVRTRLQVYEEQTAPLVEFYGHRAGVLHRVDGDREIEVVQVAIQHAVGVLA